MFAESSPESPVKRPLTIGVESLDTMLYPMGIPLVSPTISERETVGRLPILDTRSMEEGSIAITKKILTIAIGTSLGQDHSVLAPRPVAIRTSTSHLDVTAGSNTVKPTSPTSGQRLNKFVRRLYDMLEAEQNSGLVEWRKGLLVLYSTDAFAKKLLPKYFNTQNFKTFRRQLNYYGFLHVRSFSTAGSSTTALWVNRSLAKEGTSDIAAILQLKRVEPCKGAKTVEGRRHRKEMALSIVEDDIGVSARSLQLDQIRISVLNDHPHEELFHPVPHLLSLGPRDSFPQQEKISFDLSVTAATSGEFESESVPDEPASTKLYDLTSESAANVLLMLSRG